MSICSISFIIFSLSTSIVSRYRHRVCISNLRLFKPRAFIMDSQHDTIPARLFSFAAEHSRLSLAAAALIIVFPVLTILHVILSPLRGVPGPIAARFTRLWYLIKVWQGSFHTDNIKLHERYGKSYPPGSYQSRISEYITETQHG